MLLVKYFPGNFVFHWLLFCGYVTSLVLSKMHATFWRRDCVVYIHIYLVSVIVDLVSLVKTTRVAKEVKLADPYVPRVKL